MNQLMDVHQEKIIAWIATGTFLLIHILLLIMFALCKVTPMVCFNVFSISFYFCSFLVIQKAKFRLFVVSTYLEVLLHMSLAVVFTGWENGFQITLIGIGVMAFFSEFLGRCLKVTHVRAVPLCVLGSITYLACLIYCHSYQPTYPLPERLSYWLHIFWTIVTFGINTAALWCFTFISFHTDELLSRQAGTDTLTGLSNRLYAAKAGREYMREGGWLAILDVDDFKQINDSYGHIFGDEVLVTIARLMEENNSASTICRWGGEEFLLMGFAADTEDAQRQLDRLRQAVERQHFQSEGRQVRVTVTMGLTPFAGETELTEWISLADKKLYLGKRSGKNQVVL